MVRRRQHPTEQPDDPRTVDALRRLDEVAAAGDLDVAAYVQARAALTTGSSADVDRWLDRLGLGSLEPTPPSPPPDAGHEAPDAGPSTPVAASRAPALPVPVAVRKAPPAAAVTAGPFAPPSGAVNLGPGPAAANLPPGAAPGVRRWWRLPRSRR